jgi:hypothetical protein
MMVSHDVILTFSGGLAAALDSTTPAAATAGSSSPAMGILLALLKVAACGLLIVIGSGRIIPWFLGVGRE